MGMNAQLHLVLSSELLEKLKKEATEKEITISELCRQKINGNSQLDNIELTLERLIKKLKVNLNN